MPPRAVWPGRPGRPAPTAEPEHDARLPQLRPFRHRAGLRADDRQLRRRPPRPPGDARAARVRSGAPRPAGDGDDLRAEPARLVRGAGRQAGARTGPHRDAARQALRARAMRRRAGGRDALRCRVRRAVAGVVHRQGPGRRARCALRPGRRRFPLRRPPRRRLRDARCRRRGARLRRGADDELRGARRSRPPARPCAPPSPKAA